MACPRNLADFATELCGLLTTPAVLRGQANARGSAEFNRVARELFALQFAANPAYRVFCEARGVTPAAVKHWDEIPAIPASAFKELDLSCIPGPDRCRLFESSGTTRASRGQHWHNEVSLQLYEASLKPWFEAHLLADAPAARCSVLILTPPPAQAPTSSLVFMFDAIRRTLGFDSSVFLGSVEADGWRLDHDRTVRALEAAVAERRPLLLLGTAFSFVHLLDHLGARSTHLKLPPGSRALETGGYKGRSRTLPKPDLHALISRLLGIDVDHIVCEYGMSELSSQAYDRVVGPHRSPAPRVFQFPPWARVLIISPELGTEVAEGETGLIRVFDLANVYSVMAIQTDDLGIRRGTGFELLGRASLAEPRGCSLMAV